VLVNCDGEGGIWVQKYLIRPWIHDGYPDPDMTVPPEVEAIAQKVISRYDMTLNNMTLITAKSDKGGAIWKIDTNRGPRSLKVLHRAPERSLFSVGAQDYLVKQGARVPQLIPTKKGRLYTQGGGKVWIVTEWIESLTPASKIDLAGAQELCYGLGEFHRLSRGYVEPPGASHASRLYRWPRTYEKVLTKIGWCRVLGEVYSDLPASRTLLQVVDKYEDQARRAIQLLEQSPYASLVERGESEWGLVHQDYGWSNGQNGPGGIWIIDLDGVAFDLPIRDLRKLITGTMDDMGVWDPSWMRGMIDAYNEANPMEPELYEVLLVDMALPNELYKNIKEIVYDPVTFMTTELEPLLQRLESSDSTKWQALKELGVVLEETGGRQTSARATTKEYGAKTKEYGTRWNDSAAKWNTAGAASTSSASKSHDTPQDTSQDTSQDVHKQSTNRAARSKDRAANLTIIAAEAVSTDGRSKSNATSSKSKPTRSKSQTAIVKSRDKRRKANTDAFQSQEVSRKRKGAKAQ
jgi:spore coat protein SA